MMNIKKETCTFKRWLWDPSGVPLITGRQYEHKFKIGKGETEDGTQYDTLILQGDDVGGIFVWQMMSFYISLMRHDTPVRKYVTQHLVPCDWPEYSLDQYDPYVNWALNNIRQRVRNDPTQAGLGDQLVWSGYAMEPQIMASPELEEFLKLILNAGKSIQEHNNPKYQGYWVTGEDGSVPYTLIFDIIERAVKLRKYPEAMALYAYTNVLTNLSYIPMELLPFNFELSNLRLYRKEKNEIVSEDGVCGSLYGGKSVLPPTGIIRMFLE